MWPIELMHHRKEIGRGFYQVAACAEIGRDLRPLQRFWAEGQQGLIAVNILRIETKGTARRIMTLELTRRAKRVVVKGRWAVGRELAANDVFDLSARKPAGS